MNNIKGKITSQKLKFKITHSPGLQVKICVGDNKKLIALSTSTTPRKLSLVHPNNQGSIISQIAAPKFRGTIVLDEF